MAESSAPTSSPSTAPSAEPNPRSLTRREVLIGAGGIAALLLTNTGTAVAAEKISTQAAEARAADEIDLLKRQLALYKDLERIGLDRLIRGALETYDRLWPPIRSGINLLLEGVGIVERGLTHYEGGLPLLRSAIEVMKGLLNGVEAQVNGARDILNEILARTAPISDAVSGFFTWLLSKIPFGLGVRVIEATNRVSALVGSVQPLIADTRLRLLGPLDDDWLSTEEGEGLAGRIFDPLHKKLLEPLRGHLEEVKRAADGWDADVAKPLRAAITERDGIRQKLQEIEQAYKTQPDRL